MIEFTWHINIFAMTRLWSQVSTRLFWIHISVQCNGDTCHGIVVNVLLLSHHISLDNHCGVLQYSKLSAMSQN